MNIILLIIFYLRILNRRAC